MKSKSGPRGVDRTSADPLRIVAIGGGTGLSTLLHGLKRYARSPLRSQPSAQLEPEIEITAVVTVTDDGGSSGILRREFDVLPPGDIRNCMVALSEDEALLSRLFQYRFVNGRGLKGHSFGNLFLTALTHMTGDFPHAVKLSSEVLVSLGRIFPSTEAHVTLEAQLANGKVVTGETRISRARSRIEKVTLKPRGSKPLKETLAAIAAADLITLGPGSLFTSVIPNLLVDGIPQAIRDSPACKAYFINLMWQPWETMQFSAADHVRAVQQHSLPDLLDCVVVNTRPIGAALRRRYAAQKVYPVQNDLHRFAEAGLRVVGRNLLAKTEMARHDPDTMAAIAIDLAGEGRQRRLRSAPRRKTRSIQ